MFCGVCQKSFSGPACFKQHEESEKHKKKVQLAKSTGSCLEASQANFPLQEVSCPISCSVCQLNFDGINNYQKHVNSIEHANVVHNKETVKQKDELERKLELEDNLVNQVLQNTTDPNIYQPSLKNMKSVECSENSNFSYASHGIAEVVDVPIQSGNNFFCQICSVNCSGAIPYSQHINSQGHKKKQSIKEMCNKFEANQCGEGEPSFSITEMTNKAAEACALNLMRCDVCNKCFSGPIPYDQHLKSNVHQKKLTEKRLLEEMGCARSDLPLSEDSLDSSLSKKDDATVDSTYGTDWKCDVCNKSFSGPIPYDLHLKSNVHQKKLTEKRLLEEMGFARSDLPLSEDSFDSSLSKKDDTIVDSTYGTNWKCDVCNKSFSGPIPYDQHLKSNVHQKKLTEKRLLEEMGRARSNLNTSTGNDSFLLQDSSVIQKEGNAVINSCNPVWKCDLCNKAFNGECLFQDHMKSALHKKKESEKLSLESGNMNKGTEQYYCNLCFIQCTGIAPFQQHLSSAAHRSKQLSCNMKSTENLKHILFNSDNDTQNDLSKDSTNDDSNLISDGTLKNLTSLEELRVTLISSDQEVKFE